MIITGINFYCATFISKLTIGYAMLTAGLTIGIPYWDWTNPLDDLPEVARNQLFLDQAGGSAKENNWFQGHVTVDGTVHNTARAIDERLFQKVVSFFPDFLFFYPKILRKIFFLCIKTH